MYYLCSRYFDDKEDIETAINNGMLLVFTHIKNYSTNKGDIKGWIYVIVRNEALKIIKQKKTSKQTVELRIEEREIHAYNPFENSSDDAVFEYLKYLSITTRAVLSLFYIEGLLIKEIAKSLDMKEGTVKWHLNEGRNKLKSFFNQEKKSRVYAG